MTTRPASLVSSCATVCGPRARMAASAPSPSTFTVRRMRLLAIVFELHLDGKGAGSQSLHDRLKLVPALSLHPYQVPLNRGLNFFPRSLDELHDLLGLLGRNALLQRDRLP